MSIMNGDVLFSRNADPVVVRSQEPGSNKVVLDDDRNLVREKTRFGVKNGLPEAAKEAFNTILSEVNNADAKREIDDLHSRINDLREAGGNQRLIRYLEAELTHRMLKENYHPKNYGSDQFSLGM